METRAKNWILWPYLVSAHWIEEESTILVTDTFCVLSSIINWCIWAASALLSWCHNWPLRTLLSEYSDTSSAGVFELHLHFHHEATTDLSEHYCQNILINHQLVYLSCVCTSIMMPQLICQNTTVRIFWSIINWCIWAASALLSWCHNWSFRTLLSCIWGPSSLLSWGHNWSVRTLLSESSDK